ncbi:MULTISPECIES: hypothetical protein [unclassified Saccharopolyspora]|uniref:hypothetical protein n=1 Tax=unclassified Saccharopolyspora TaxID=2646250 RepID=UPI001CD20685|nr:MULTISPECIES: hypothetical protein [unclassified Saccharopolyspora]MCA1192645.1 hypothetical protein [Saccharopolyspora sp. 6V]MCA1227745.1 hypothetical protein [Saccharopolyspora sp. 6M]
MRMRNLTLAVAGAGLLLGAPGVALAAGGDELHVTADGLVKPNQEITVTADCPGLGATATSSFGSVARLGPAADAGVLIGSLRVPNQVPAPEGDANTITVRCDSGETGWISLPDAGNSDSQRPAGL